MLGGGAGDGNKKAVKAYPKYYPIEHNGKDDSKNLFEYIEYLLEVAYLAIVLIFLLCGPISTGSKIEINTANTAIQTKLGLNNDKYSKVKNLVDKLLVPGVKVSYKLLTGKANGGALKGGGNGWTNVKKLLRISNRMIPAPPGFGDGDQAPTLPDIDISLPTLEEMEATNFNFDILKMEFILCIEKIL